MIFKSSIIAQGSGSIAGTTFSRNKGGAYMRSRVIPTNPNSTFQQAVRTLMANLTANWLNVLTAAQRAAWETYASQVPVINALGEQIFLTGLNWYVKVNVPRQQASIARVDDAPPSFTLTELTAPVLTATATTGLSVAFNNMDEWANTTGGFLAVFAARPNDASINYFKGPYRFAGKVLGNGTTPPTSPAALTAPFAFVAGQRIFIRAVAQAADGRPSADFRSFDDAS